MLNQLVLSVPPKVFESHLKELTAPLAVLLTGSDRLGCIGADCHDSYQFGSAAVVSLYRSIKVLQFVQECCSAGCVVGKEGLWCQAEIEGEKNWGGGVVVKT